VDTDDEPRLEAWERRTDYPLTALAVLYLAVYAVQVLATRPGQAWWWWLDTALWAVWAIFVADYLARLALARRTWRFVYRHPLDLLIVAAPFFRFLRLLRLVAAISTLGRVLRDDFRGRVGSYLIVSVSLLSVVAALGVYEAERDAPDASIVTFADALWWVLTTITTVGYGDLYPTTTEGRLVAAGLMLAGIAVLGTVTAAIATWFLEQIGASDASEAVSGTGARRDPAETRHDELLAELRHLRGRLDALEADGRPAEPDRDGGFPDAQRQRGRQADTTRT
jgi:voltage-gated potassium channel